MRKTVHWQVHVISNDIHDALFGCAILQLPPLGMYPSETVAPQAFQLQENLLNNAAKRWNCWCRTRGFSRDLFDNELDRKHGKGQLLATERFDTSPSTGDSRTVDWCEIWAMRQCSETLDFGTAVQRVFQARELVKALETVGVPQLQRLKFNGDDHPYAYRWIPTRPEEQFLNMVAARIIVQVGNSKGCARMWPACIFTT